jgi:hypothetical protein
MGDAAYWKSIYCNRLGALLRFNLITANGRMPSTRVRYPLPSAANASAANFRPQIQRRIDGPLESFLGTLAHGVAVDAMRNYGPQAVTQCRRMPHGGRDTCFRAALYISDQLPLPWGTSPDRTDAASLRLDVLPQLGHVFLYRRPSHTNTSRPPSAWRHRNPSAFLSKCSEHSYVRPFLGTAKQFGGEPDFILCQASGSSGIKYSLLPLRQSRIGNCFQIRNSSHLANQFHQFVRLHSQCICEPDE